MSEYLFCLVTENNSRLHCPIRATVLLLLYLLQYDHCSKSQSLIALWANLQYPPPPAPTSQECNSTMTGCCLWAAQCLMWRAAEDCVRAVSGEQSGQFSRPLQGHIFRHTHSHTSGWITWCFWPQSGERLKTYVIYEKKKHVAPQSNWWSSHSKARPATTLHLNCTSGILFEWHLIWKY